MIIKYCKWILLLLLPPLCLCYLFVALGFSRGNRGSGNLLALFHCRHLSLAFMCTSKCSCEQIWTLGWAFMHRNTNAQAHQGLHRVIEPWTVKMSAPINNNAGLSMRDLNVCTSSCIFRWSTLEVYLCHTVSGFFPLLIVAFRVKLQPWD